MVVVLSLLPYARHLLARLTELPSVNLRSAGLRKTPMAQKVADGVEQI
jgi:hypothetical protein